jgi:hypothetical protein
MAVVLIMGIGISTADASPKSQISSTRTHAEVSVGAKIVTVSNQKAQWQSSSTYICSVIRGLSYGVALVGIHSMAISLPSMASVAGTPVAAVAVGISVVSAGITIATMIANDRLCTLERIVR